jgi:hypothetical protein
MLPFLSWPSFCLALVGSCMLSFGIVAKHQGSMFYGTIALAVGLALFAIWTTITISGAMGSVLGFTSAIILVLLLKPNHSSVQQHDAPHPSHDSMS